jgi:hypothetical protein
METYGVFLNGGSLSDAAAAKTPKFIGSKEEAKEYAKCRNKNLSPGEKSYYKMRYSVRKIKK